MEPLNWLSPNEKLARFQEWWSSISSNLDSSKWVCYMFDKPTVSYADIIAIRPASNVSIFSFLTDSRI